MANQYGPYGGYGGPQQGYGGQPQPGGYGRPAAPGGQPMPPPGGQPPAAPGSYGSVPPGGPYGAFPPGQVPPGQAPPGQMPRYGQPQPHAQPTAPGGGYGGHPPPGGYNQPGAPQGGAYGQAPTGYAGGPPPAGFAQQPPQQGNWGPPPGIDPNVFQWFQAVDADRSGRINCSELQQALTNANWTTFNAECCRLMIDMFDRDRTGQIELPEFQTLWNYLQQWRQIFEQYDRDRSGSIEAQELCTAWNQMGYRVSPQFAAIVVSRFDNQTRRALTLDNFITACVMLKSLTDAFAQKDTERKGIITISYEDLLSMVMLHKP